MNKHLYHLWCVTIDVIWTGVLLSGCLMCVVHGTKQIIQSRSPYGLLWICVGAWLATCAFRMHVVIGDTIKDWIRNVRQR